jgi:hypothetical protein
VRFSAILLLLTSLASAAGPKPELLSVSRIWDQAPHSAFGDLLYTRNQWFAIFREGLGHVAGAKLPQNDGKIRVISSPDGKTWRSLALLEEPGVDLRDPHLSETADHRLMIVAGGSRYPNGKYAGRKPRVMFSSDGVKWTAPQAVLEEGMWLWRVTWHQGRAWGVAKFGSPGVTEAGNPRRAILVSSPDGLKWNTISELTISGADETTVRFLKDDTMIAFVRRVWDDGNLAAIGRAKPPYKQWTFTMAKESIGGPNLIVLPDGRMIAGGRHFRGGYGKDPCTAIGWLTPDSYEPSLELPSGGDNSYPGFAWHDGLLWTLYYSSHESNTAVYLAKIRLPPRP